MDSTAPQTDRDVRYEPDERPPAALAFGMGAQQAVLCIAGVVLTPVIVIRAAGEGDPYLTWAVFAALLVSGVTTMMQAVRVGRRRGIRSSWAPPAPHRGLRDGARRGRAGLLAAISALFQFLLSERLSLLRRHRGRHRDHAVAVT